MDDSACAAESAHETVATVVTVNLKHLPHLSPSDAVVDAEGEAGEPAGLALRRPVETVRRHALKAATAESGR